jgi:hypothetical protein
MSDFQAQRLGLTAFMASNRVDFVLDGPEMDEPARCSAFYDNAEAKLKLDGKQLKIEAVSTDSEGAPKQLQVKWGRRVIKLGRRNNAAGPVSFYRSLEAGNEAAAPRSADAVNAALANFVS